MTVAPAPAPTPCTGTHHRGRRACKNVAIVVHEGQPLCAYHAERAREREAWGDMGRPKCSASTRRGGTCGHDSVTVVEGQPLCRRHLNLSQKGEYLDTVVGVRLTRVERAHLDTLAAAYGHPVSELGRRALLGVPMPPAQPSEALAKFTDELRRVGVNVNQVARSLGAMNLDPRKSIRVKELTDAYVLLADLLRKFREVLP